MDVIKRSVKRTRWLAGASLAVAACATVQPPEYALDHPANPAAPAAAAAPTSSTLTSYRSFANAVVPETEPAPNPDQDTVQQPEQSSQESAHEHHR